MECKQIHWTLVYKMAETGHWQQKLNLFSAKPTHSSLNHPQHHTDNGQKPQPPPTSPFISSMVDHHEHAAEYKILCLREMPEDVRNSVHVGESKVLYLVTESMWPKLCSLTCFPNWNPKLAQPQVKVFL